MDVWLLSRLLVVNKIVLFGGCDVLVLGFNYTLFCVEAVALGKIIWSLLLSPTS